MNWARARAALLQPPPEGAFEKRAVMEVKSEYKKRILLGNLFKGAEFELKLKTEKAKKLLLRVETARICPLPLLVCLSQQGVVLNAYHSEAQAPSRERIIGSR